MKNIFAVCFAIFLCSGCATVDSLQPGAGGANFTVKAHTYDEVWAAAIHSVPRNLRIVDQRKAQGQIRAESGSGLTGTGELVGVFISPAGRNAPSYNIQVQSTKRGPIAGRDWSRNIVAGIKAELGNRGASSAVPLKESLSPSEEVVALPTPELPAQATEVKGAEMFTQVERLARQSGCVPVAGATLIARTAGAETYQASCQNGHRALFKCEMRQCRRVD